MRSPNGPTARPAAKGRGRRASGDRARFPSCRSRPIRPRGPGRIASPSPANNRAAINRQIRSLAARAGVVSTVIDDLIDREASLDDARNALFDNLLSRGAAALRAAPPASTDDPAVFVRAAGEASTAASPRTMRRAGRRGSICPCRSRRSRASACGGPASRRKACGATPHHPRAPHDERFSGDLGRYCRENAARHLPAAPAASGSSAARPGAGFPHRARLMLDSTGFDLRKVNEHGEFTPERWSRPPRATA